MGVVRFPVEQAMSTRVAEEKMGGIRMYRYPEREPRDPEEWLKVMFSNRSVLLGWESVKEGIVKGFKKGKVMHLVTGIKASDALDERRPIVEVACKLNTYPVWNWRAEDSVTRVPVILLSPEQAPYFKLCQRCENRIKKMLRGRG